MKYAFLAAATALLVLAGRPEFDLAAASLFYAGDGHFIGNEPAGIIARDAARLAPLLLFAGLLLLYIGRRLGLVAASHAPDRRSMLFLVLSLALGPGLLVDGVLKDHMHRPRPVQIHEFGGRLSFEPFYYASGSCRRNCSFPSGETAAAFWTMAPASLAPLPMRPLLVGLALVFGLATGGLRMAFGGHFLSDVLCAGLLTLALIGMLRRLLRLSTPPPQNTSS
ncbi:MAG: phosphatase PAP2 family protein [Methylovirgula sp.]